MTEPTQPTLQERVQAALAMKVRTPVYVDIVNPSGGVSYRRWSDHPDVQEALGTQGYTVRRSDSQYELEGEPHPLRALLAETAAALAAAQAEADAWRTIPQDVAQMVVATGRAEWAATVPETAEGHGANMTRSVQLTADRYGHGGPQPMQLLVIEGTETVIGYVGTSPNSPGIAQAMTGAWNWLHEQSAHALAQADAAGRGA